MADLVLHLQCIDIQKATFTTIGSRTVQHYRRGARQTIQTREQWYKKRTTKFCPAATSTNGKKGLTLNTKISQFYISNGLCWLLLRTTLIQRNMSTDRIFRVFFSFFFLSSLITTCSPNCPTHNALLHMTCSWRLTLREPFFFHITKLQFYSHIVKFNFLFYFIFLDFKVLHFTCSIRTSQINSNPELKASEISFLLLR